MSDASIYTPRPGTIPARVIAKLQELPAGSIVSGRDLAESLGVRPSDMPSAMEFVLKHGLVRRKLCLPEVGKKAGVFGYSLPIGDAFDQDEANGGKPLQRVVPAAQAKAPTAVVSSVFAMAEHMGPGALPFDLVAADSAAPPTPAGLNWKPGKPLKAALTEPEAAPSAAPAAALNAAPAPAVAPPLECALWSNGELWLRIDGAEPLVLDQAKTKHLIHYLDRMAIEPLATTT